MTLAIRGDRASCLSIQLANGTWLLAVARGFGRIGGVPAETALLGRLRAECRRRGRNPLFRRAVERPRTAATAILAVLTRINGALYASTASHDDYVTAAASLTAVLVVQRFAYVIHAGATAAYLARGETIVPLCAGDPGEETPLRVLSRAFAAAPALDVEITQTRLLRGDAIVLLGRRLPEMDLTALLERLERDEACDQVLVARFDEESPRAPARRSHGRARASLVARIAAVIGLLAAAVLSH